MRLLWTVAGVFLTAVGGLAAPAGAGAANGWIALSSGEITGTSGTFVVE